MNICRSFRLGFFCRAALFAWLWISGPGPWLDRALAQPPAQLNYQGRLVQGTNLYNGIVSLRFRMYTNSLSGAHHFESTNVATVVDGLYATAIGPFVTLGTLDDALNRPENWLEVMVNGVTLSPRERLLAVPYARQTHGLRVTGANSIILNPAGGSTVAVNAQHAAVGGGLQNLIFGAADYAVIGGGDLNEIQENAYASVIAGGQQNKIQTNVLFASIGGGFMNTIQTNSSFGVVGGGDWNEIRLDARYSVIGGGFRNIITGGASNSVISGGYRNFVESRGSTVAGGQSNTIYRSAEASLIAGGANNLIQTNASDSVVGGGVANEIGRGASGATVGGGILNVIGAGSQYSTIPGGYQVRIGSNAISSFAAGRQAVANHSGTFVWADSTVEDFASTADNQFSVRARGGVRFSDDTPSLSFGSSTRQMINLWGTEYGIGVQNFAQYFRTDGDFYWYHGGQHNNATGNSGSGGTTRMALTTAGLTVNGTFVSSSDREAKQEVRPVNPQAILDRLATLPIATWRYRQDPDTLHVGPMAQDFYAAFGVGPDDKHIATVDADGIALAAIQALARENKELKLELNRLQAQTSAWPAGQVAELAGEIEQLKASLREAQARLRVLEIPRAPRADP